MNRDDRYRSEISGAIHRTVEGLQRVGVVDAATMRKFDEECLTPIGAFGPEALKELRRREGASQAVLAKHLGVATATVGQWERGQRKPDGPAAKLLTLIEAHGLAYIR